MVEKSHVPEPSTGPVVPPPPFHVKVGCPQRDDVPRSVTASTKGTLANTMRDMAFVKAAPKNTNEELLQLIANLDLSKKLWGILGSPVSSRTGANDVRAKSL